MQTTGLELVSPPSEFPVSLTEIKDHIRIDWDEEDSLLTGLLDSATTLAGVYTGRTFLETGWRAVYPGFPSARPGYLNRRVRSEGHSPAWFLRDVSPLRLPRPPLVAVESVEYIDGNGADAVLDPGAYRVATGGAWAEIVPRAGHSWPLTYPAVDAVRVDYRAGYGPSPADVPGPVKSAILLVVAEWYANRGDGGACGSGAGKEGLSGTVRTLLDSVSVQRYA